MDHPLLTLELTLSFTNRLRTSRKIPLKIPKGARIPAADALSQTIDTALESNQPADWMRLQLFAVLGLGIPSTDSREHKSSLATIVKNNIGDFLENLPQILAATDNNKSNHRNHQIRRQGLT